MTGNVGAGSANQNLIDPNLEANLNQTANTQTDANVQGTHFNQVIAERMLHKLEQIYNLDLNNDGKIGIQDAMVNQIIYELEKVFNVDLNKDGLVGIPEIPEFLKQVISQIEQKLGVDVNRDGKIASSPQGALPGPHDPCTCSPYEIIPADGRVWGDPHFEHSDGTKYDVQGENGKVYTLLSDDSIQVNGHFGAWNNETTVIKELGISTADYSGQGNSQIYISSDGTLTVNGIQVEGRHAIAGGYVEQVDDNVIVKAGEYDMKVETQNGYLNISFQSDNVNADGVMPHGLWGQAADNNPNAVTGTGQQGEGVIEGTYKDYEVSNLFDLGGKYTRFNTYKYQPQEGQFANFNPFILQPVITIPGLSGFQDTRTQQPAPWNLAFVYSPNLNAQPK